MTDSDHRPPIAESPWLWVCLFATVAVIVLATIGPKYRDRQAEIERQYQSRQRAGHVVMNEHGRAAPSTAENTIIGLDPLILVFGAIVAAGWAVLWWRYFRPAKASKTTTTSASGPGA